MKIYLAAVLWLQCAGVGMGSPTLGSFYSGAGGTGTGGPTTCSIAPCVFTACNVGYKLTGCTAGSAGMCEKCTNTIAVGKYYSGKAIDSSGVCGLGDCAVCPQGQKRVGCGTASNEVSTGTCTTCGTPAAGKYWGPSVTSDVFSCPVADKTKCLSGSYTTGSSDTAAGVCTACTTLAALVAKNYWVAPTAWDSACSQLAQTKCDAGYVNSVVASPQTTSAGDCLTACPVLTNNGYYYVANTDSATTCVQTKTACSDGACADGEYRKDCGTVFPFTSSGTCSACTNAASTQVYNSKGSWNNNCGVADCPTTGCTLGKYVTGCGAKTSALGCAACTSAVAGTSFYPSVGISSTCSTQNCKVCDNGKYSLSCTTVLDGTCDGSCTN